MTIAVDLGRKATKQTNKTKSKSNKSEKQVCLLPVTVLIVVLNFSLLVANLLPADNFVGLILAQNDDGPLKWAIGPYPVQIHANFQILMGHLKFL